MDRREVDRPNVKDERDRWRAVAFCGMREGLLKVALPHHGVPASDAAVDSLKSFPPHYELSPIGGTVGWGIRGIQQLRLHAPMNWLNALWSLMILYHGRLA